MTLTGRRLWMPVLCVVALAATDGTTRYLRQRDARFADASSAAHDSSVRFLSEPVPLLLFTAHDLDGRDVSPATWLGKVTIVNFWATWCLPCRTEIPALAALQEKYRSQLLVIGVLQDSASLPMVRAFASAVQINYPIVRITSQIEQSFGEALALPTTYLVDQQGRIVAVHVGLIDAARVEREIAALISKSL